MNVTYSTKNICDFIGSTTAKFQLSLFGRWCEFSITSFCIGNSDHAADEERSVALSYGIRPLEYSDIKGSRFDGVANGLLSLVRGSGGNRQFFDQEISFPLITGSLFNVQAIKAGDVGDARDLIRGVLRGIESMIETVRQTIRASFPDDIKNMAIDCLQDRYGKRTSASIKSILRELHWALMLNKSGCTEQQLNCIIAMASVNPPKYNRIDVNGETDIPLAFGSQDVVEHIRETVQRVQAERLYRQAQIDREEQDAKFAKASGKARGLLAQICGSKLAKQFAKHGFITIRQNGFVFEIPANSFVRCTDPNGKKAELCIHSQSFACNPIDEIILAFLHIRHKLADYLRVANLYGVERGFSRKVAN